PQPQGRRGRAPRRPPLRLRSRVFRREVPAVKHTGLFGQLHERRAARREGFDDAVFTDGSGVVSEGPTWNIGFHDGRDLVWPEADVLPGVTMTLLRRSLGGVSAPVTRELPGIQAAFATSAGTGVRAVAAVDERRLADDHPVLATLRAAYEAVPAEPLE
ncbi:aminotransferase class IV, partial [Streptomyces sp. SBT349]|uniref:aminotransferase class IV n=1 Tax=Streptomyces sp. SBT349 TaxID=1580539 RepID=UPI00066EDA27